MSLIPIGQNTKYITSFQSSINNNETQGIKAKNNKFYLEKDVFDDGKISASKSLKHFAKGIISPIKMLFSSPKSMLIGAGAVVGSAALCAAFPPLLPIMVAVGVTTGSLQFIKGGYKALTAKTDKQAQEAWEDIGSGTFSVGTSILGAKSSLKASGIEKVDDLGMLNATIKCFKQVPSNIAKSFKMVKNGTCWTSLRNSILKPLNYVDPKDLEKLEGSGYGAEKLAEIKKYSDALNKEGIASARPEAGSGQKSCIQELIDILPDDLKDTLRVRVKSSSSIKDKLINKLTDKKNPIKIESLDDARNSIGDLIGTQLVLDDVSDAQIQLLVDYLSDGVSNGKIKFLAIDNYKGKDITPYFNSDNLDAIHEAVKSRNMDLKQFEGSGTWNDLKSIKPSGYTTTQINVKYKDGSLGEFQIRGKGVHKLADVEHIPYDLRKSKDLSAGNHLLRKLYTPLEKYVKLLSNEGYDEYNSYLNALYKYYRKLETGHTNLTQPQIKDYLKSSPAKLIQSEKELSAIELQKAYDNIIKMLDINKIEKLHTEASWLKKIPKTDRKKVLVQSLTTYMAAESNRPKQNVNN